jgi:hypothetical protein
MSTGALRAKSPSAADHALFEAHSPSAPSPAIVANSRHANPRLPPELQTTIAKLKQM